MVKCVPSTYIWVFVFSWMIYTDLSYRNSVKNYLNCYSMKLNGKLWSWNLKCVSNKTDIEIIFVANIILQTMIVLNFGIKYINSTCTTSILILLLQLLVPGQVLKSGLRQHGNLRYISYVCIKATNFREGHSFLLVSYLNWILCRRNFESISIIECVNKVKKFSSNVW